MLVCCKSAVAIFDNLTSVKMAAFIDFEALTTSNF